MKNIKDLKEEILHGHYNNFYVFFGPDYGIRKHYINKIAEQFEKVVNLEDMELIANSQKGSGLFSVKTLNIVHGDLAFARRKASYIQNVINKLKDDAVIVVYEEELPTSTLFKEFEEFITDFPLVEDKIAYEFIDSEIHLSLASKKDLALNCKNNYNNIRLESDKIRNYAESKNISQQLAYEELSQAGQLLYEYDIYNPNDFMNDVLKGNFKNLAYWSAIVNLKYQEQFWITIESIFNDYLIAYFLVKHGKYEGGSMAYNHGMNWGRIKTLREFVIPYEADYLLETAFEVSDLDKKVKSGKISQEELFDRFLCTIM